MAIAHISGRIVGRTQAARAGKRYSPSSVAASAYLSRSKLEDARAGETHDFRHRAGDVLWEGVFAPKDAPDWARDRQQLWNHVEQFERRRDAQLAKSFNLALPHELTVEQNRWVLQDWIRDNFTRKGFVADAAIHRPDPEGDPRNIHAHVLVTLRRIDGEEFERIKPQWNPRSAEARQDALQWRESWERTVNRHLERHGFEERISVRPLKDQGIDREPQRHLGRDATQLERQGVETARGDELRAIFKRNAEVIDLAAERERRQQERAAEQARPQETARAPQEVAEPRRMPEAAPARPQEAEARERSTEPQPRQEAPQQSREGNQARAEPTPATTRPDESRADQAARVGREADLYRQAIAKQAERERAALEERQQLRAQAEREARAERGWVSRLVSRITGADRREAEAARLRDQMERKELERRQAENGERLAKQLTRERTRQAQERGRGEDRGERPGGHGERPGPGRAGR